MFIPVNIMSLPIFNGAWAGCNTKIKIAPSGDKWHILIRILVTVSICKGLRRINAEARRGSGLGLQLETGVYSSYLKKKTF